MMSPTMRPGDTDAGLDQRDEDADKETRKCVAVDAARANGFKSINIDLIYGLPYQTVDSFAVTP